MQINEPDDSMSNMAHPEVYRQLQDELHTAITKAYHKAGERLGVDEFGMLQSYVLVTNFTGFDGEKRLDLMASEDARIWELKGMLDHVLTDLNAQQLSLYMAEDDE